MILLEPFEIRSPLGLDLQVMEEGHLGARSCSAEWWSGNGWEEASSLQSETLRRLSSSTFIFLIEDVVNCHLLSEHDSSIHAPLLVGSHYSKGTSSVSSTEEVHSSFKNDFCCEQAMKRHIFWGCCSSRSNTLKGSEDWECGSQMERGSSVTTVANVR